MLALNEDGSVQVPWRAATAMEGLGQRLRARLQTWRGTWFLDTDVGIPYAEHVDEQQLSLRQLTDEMTRAILECPGVARVSDVAVSMDESTGEASYAATVWPTDSLLSVTDNATLNVSVSADPGGGQLRAYVRTGGI